jgi:hypothetical protein
LRLSLFAAVVTASCAVLLGFSAEARAADMDPTPERLVLQPPGLPPGQTCQGVAADPEAAVRGGRNPTDFPCRPDNVAFANMVSELGFATAPNAFHPARTTGIGGFALTFQANFTKINPDNISLAENGAQVKYWQQGSQGAMDSATKRYSVVNSSPDSLLQIYSINARKGLPYGFEIAGQLGTVANTSMWVTGADVHWALMEGFRTGSFGILPDFAVGGGVRTVTGNSKLHLTTVGIDGQLSKPITIAQSATLTPYVGYQRLIIFGDSATVDSTPNVDGLARCGYSGADGNTGAPVCRNKLSNGADANYDFNNNMSFAAVRVHRHRGILGLNYRYEILYLATQFLVDLVPPNDENPGLGTTHQWTLSFEAGVYF